VFFGKVTQQKTTVTTFTCITVAAVCDGCDSMVMFLTSANGRLKLST
jgi:hypothetical protein